MKSPLLATCISLGVALDCQALESIGIYADPAGGSCTVTAERGGPSVDLYVLALVDSGLPIPGIQAAEFAVTGLPLDQYTAVATPAPV